MTIQKPKIFEALFVALFLFISCGGDTRVETPSLGNVLGSDIESLKKDMSNAELVYSDDEFASGRVENAFEWEYLPKQSKSEEFKSLISDLDMSAEEVDSDIKFDEVSLEAETDREGRVVSVTVRSKFEEVGDFRSYYMGKLLGMMAKYEKKSKKLLCLNVDPNLLGGSTDDTEKFELDIKDVFNWEKVKRCEQVGVVGRHRGEPAVFAVQLNARRKPEERTKGNKGDRYVVEEARFKGYQN